MFAVQSSLNVLAAIICFAAFVVLKFMLVPLTLAYFVTFLQAPFLDLFEKRPISCGQQPTEETKDLPESEQEMEEKLDVLVRRTWARGERCMCMCTARRS